MKRTSRITAWLLFGGALALRLGWVGYSGWSNGTQLQWPDEELHWQLASNLVQDGNLVTDDGRYAPRMPLYPLFLAWFALFGEIGILLARIGQAVIGALTTWIAYRFAAKTCDTATATVAGALLACDPFGVFFANLLLTETLFTCLAVWLTASAWKLLAQHHVIRSLAATALLGAAVIMTRPSAAAWVPVLWFVLLVFSVDRGRVFLQLLLCPVVLALALLPWGLRNQAVLGDPEWLSSNGGVTLYDAQGPQADGSSNQEFLQTLELNDNLDEVTLDRTLRDMALEQMQQDPARVASLAWVKLQRMWNPTPNVAEYRSDLAAWAGAAYTLVVVIGAVIGFVRALLARARPHQLMFWRLRPGPRTFHALVWLPIVCFTLLHCIYIGSVRYRVPLMPFCALAASTAITSYTRRTAE